jgi:hypothetical protein
MSDAFAERFADGGAECFADGGSDAESDGHSGGYDYAVQHVDVSGR